jgi:hypothetical protein
MDLRHRPVDPPLRSQRSPLRDKIFPRVSQPIVCNLHAFHYLLKLPDFKRFYCRNEKTASLVRKAAW